MHNIAFITTVFRNPGDAFIRAGIEYLIQQFMPAFRPVYVDKHDIRTLEPDWWYLSSQPDRVHRMLGRVLRWRDRRRDVFDDADLIVQAGTPFYYVVPDANGSFENGVTSIGTDWVQDVWLNRIFARPATTPLMNLAVGTCQPFHSDGMEFDLRPELIEFIRKTVDRSVLTTVRETVAQSVLTRHKIPSHCVPCSAIFATDRHGIYRTSPKLVIMNYMPRGAHYTLGQNIDANSWERIFTRLHEELSARYDVVIACHSASEVIESRKILPYAKTFFSPKYDDYLELYAHAHFAVVNRVHAAMALSGLGIPSIVVGNDTRSRMAELMGLPVYFVNADGLGDAAAEHVESFQNSPAQWSEKLLDLKEDARRQYLALLADILTPIANSLSKKEGYLRSDFDRIRPDFWSPY